MKTGCRCYDCWKHLPSDIEMFFRISSYFVIIIIADKLCGHDPAEPHRFILCQYTMERRIFLKQLLQNVLT